jgi:uncharacterized protein (DUF58 family)
METHELLQKISTFPIAAEGLADDLLAGDFSSIFRGQGMEFDEARHYEAGDDVRSIDWNVSARFGTPFVKLYREERELSILILLDTSASMRGGGRFLEGRDRPSPYEQGLLAAALIALSAERGGQRVGAVFFDRELEVFPPRKGRRHVMALVSGAVRYQKESLRTSGSGRGSNLKAALAGAGRLLKRRSLVVVISDFYSLSWEQELGDLRRRHDVIALRVKDPLDMELPNLGLVTMEDPETGVKINAPSGFVSFGEAWAQWHKERGELWESVCRRCGASYLELSTADDAAAALFRFFGRRGER